MLIARNNIQQGLKCLIQQKDLCLGEFLGKGAFGYVRKGVWITEKGSEVGTIVDKWVIFIKFTKLPVGPCPGL